MGGWSPQRSRDCSSGVRDPFANGSGPGTSSHYYHRSQSRHASALQSSPQHHANTFHGFASSPVRQGSGSGQFLKSLQRSGGALEKRRSESGAHHATGSPIRLGGGIAGRKDSLKMNVCQTSAQELDKLFGTTSIATSATPGKRAGKKSKVYDRFIPNREHSTSSTSVNGPIRQHSGGSQSGSCDNTGTLDSGEFAYQGSLASACGIALDRRILAFTAEPPKASSDPNLKSAQKASNTPAIQRRRVATNPEKVLDAPGLADDYYLNLLDWSCENVIAIGLESSVYVWNAESGTVACLANLDAEVGDYVSSVRWADDGTYLAIGTAEGHIQIYDVESGNRIRTMTGHHARVGSIAWTDHTLSSGCKDGSIYRHDVRISAHKTAELMNHTSEICGLEWRSDGAMLASGGNDNLVTLWDARSTIPKFTKTNHTAAVKALAWSPWQLNLLASGGGSHDKSIHFWNTTTAARLASIETSSQVTSLHFSPHSKELVSSHGFPDNHLTLWSYPSLGKVAQISNAHETRVLHTCLSPDGTLLATGASDESLKFWKLFEAKVASKKKAGQAGAGAGAGSASGAGSSSQDGEYEIRSKQGGLTIR